MRLHDNPALWQATQTGQPVICVYVYETDETLRALGGASNWWLDKSLRTFSADIEARGGHLTLRKGSASDILPQIVSETGATAVYWNRRYDQAGRDIDTGLKTSLQDTGITVESFNANLLTEPWIQKTGSGGYYKVFSPYWRAVQAAYQPSDAFAAPKQIKTFKIASENLSDWNLHPSQPDWSDGFDTWTPGETGAQTRLQNFLSNGLKNYAADRNRPDLEGATSGLSPHLAFGEISPAEIWRQTQARMSERTVSDKQALKFLSEVAWREFSYVLLFHNPNLATEAYKPDFEAMPWSDSEAAFEAWTKGQTGYPIVDAGMRELWHTGWMHNRVRMICASFLTKHLMIDWRRGEEWFWDTLVDADAANNSASWQWVAGSGADAAPYFRIFNPITQGQKFDETGGYVRKWCPELAALPDKFLFSPWEAGPLVLNTADVTLGETYPHPIVEHKAGRERALAAYASIRKKQDAA